MVQSPAAELINKLELLDKMNIVEAVGLVFPKCVVSLVLATVWGNTVDSHSRLENGLRKNAVTYGNRRMAKS